MDKKQLRNLCLSAAILMAGLGGGTSASATECTACFHYHPWRYWICQGGDWHAMIFRDRHQCNDSRAQENCSLYPDNANPNIPPAVIPPDC